LVREDNKKDLIKNSFEKEDWIETQLDKFVECYFDSFHVCLDSALAWKGYKRLNWKSWLFFVFNPKSSALKVIAKLV
jgi:hypothetical protein